MCKQQLKGCAQISKGATLFLSTHLSTTAKNHENPGKKPPQRAINTTD